MAQLKASVLKAHGREDGPEMETTAGAVGEPNAGVGRRWLSRRSGRAAMTLHWRVCLNDP